MGKFRFTVVETVRRVYEVDIESEDFPSAVDCIDEWKAFEEAGEQDEFMIDNFTVSRTISKIERRVNAASREHRLYG